MVDLRRDAVSLLQNASQNEKRQHEITTIQKNNLAIQTFNKKVEEWKLRKTLELTEHGDINCTYSKPPYHTVDLTGIVQSLTEMGSLVLPATNESNKLTNDAGALSVNVWEKSRDAVQALISNYSAVTPQTQKAVDALNETLNATNHVIKNPTEAGAVKTLLEKNDALLNEFESHKVLRKFRKPLIAAKIASACDAICRFAFGIMFGAAICFVLTCLVPSVAVQFGAVALTALGIAITTSGLSALFTGKRPLPEVNALRKTEDSLAKAVSPKEHTAHHNSNRFFAAEKKPVAPVKVEVSAEPIPTPAARA